MFLDREDHRCVLKSIFEQKTLTFQNTEVEIFNINNNITTGVRRRSPMSDTPLTSISQFEANQQALQVSHLRR